MNYHLQVVTDGLKTICATHEERLRMFDDPDCAIDDNFDFIVLDSIEYLVETNKITEEISKGISGLYKDAEQYLNGQEWENEDKIMEGNQETVKAWQDRASSLLSAIATHNQQSQPTRKNRARLL